MFSAVAIRREHVGLLAQIPKFDALMAALAISTCLILFVLFRLESISVANLNLGGLVLQCGLPLAGAAGYCHWAGLHKLRDGCITIAWACLFVNLLPLPQYAAARSGLPFHDSFVAGIDRSIGMDCAAIVSWTRAHAGFDAFSRFSYALLEPLVGIAILIPCITGKIQFARRLILATIICALITCGISALFPVQGAWIGFGFAPSSFESAYVQQLGLLRSPGAYVADHQFNTGLVTFPSFHVCLATLCLLAIWPFRWFRVPALIAAVLIAMATVTTGWHYASDGIAGAVLAGVAFFASRRTTH